MIGLEVTINQRTFVIGVGESRGIVTSIVDLVQRKQGTAIGFTLSGRNSETEEKLKWLDQSLAVGDEIRIKVIETDQIDSPNNEVR